jgi:hypothetical protein
VQQDEPRTATFRDPVEDLASRWNRIEIDAGKEMKGKSKIGSFCATTLCARGDDKTKPNQTKTKSDDGVLGFCLRVPGLWWWWWYPPVQLENPRFQFARTGPELMSSIYVWNQKSRKFQFIFSKPKLRGGFFQPKK